MKSKPIFTFLLALLLLALPCSAAAFEEFDLVTAQFAHPNDPEMALLVVTLTPVKPWYAYAPNPEDPLVRPPHLGLTVDGTRLKNLLPHGKTKPDPLKPGFDVEVYDRPTPIFLPLPPESEGLELSGRFTAVLCDGTKCILPRVPVSITVSPDFAALPPLPPELEPVFTALTGPAPDPEPQVQEPETTAPEQSAGDEYDTDEASFDWQFSPRPFAPSLEVTGLFSAIVLGLLAGLILNVMPCVLPVVSLKLSALMSGAGEEDERERMRLFREHNLWFGLGALAYFGFLAALLGLGGLAWGELFQSPWVVAGLACLLTLLALSLFGFFYLPVVDLKFAHSSKNPRFKAFSTGMLATLLATPCSGPLLGGVLGWALLRPGAELGVVFLAIGLGMASPYFLMIAFPGLARFFPKPGAWLSRVEKGVAIFLLAAVVYLVSILPDVYGFAIWPWLALAWCLGTALWLWRIAPGWTVRALALVLAIGGPTLLFWPQDHADPWTPFEPAAFESKLGTRLLVLDFTADWCPTCKVLEATVLTDSKVAKLALKHDAEFIRVDLTASEPIREALLMELGSQSIPLVALFPAGELSGSPIVIRDLFTAGQLRQALKQARRESSQ